MNNLETWGLGVAVILYLVAMVGYFLYLSGKKEEIGKGSSLILLLGFLAHTVSLVARIILSGRAPFSNLYESMTSFAWGIVLIYLAAERIYRFKSLGAFVTPVAFLAALYATTLNKEIEPLMPALQSNWLLFHVGTAIVAYGAFALSFGTALMYLIKEGRKNPLTESFPSLEKLDDYTYRLVALGFPFMTLVLITGAVWAEAAWGTYWSWDPKETWSLITYLIYLAYLHARLNLGWKGKGAAYLSIIGFAAVIFTYLGVSFLLSGLHSYAK